MSDSTMNVQMCFKGIELPDTEAARTDDIISGRCFIKHLAVADKVFGMMYQDNKDKLLFNKTPEQSMRNWTIISAVLEDHGLEISEEIVFSILSGQEVTAAQLSHDLHNLLTPTEDKPTLRRVGQPVPVRQRINPFLGTATVATSSGLKPASIVATKLFVQDASRFSKKRTYVVDVTEKLREKEARAQRVKEKKEREAARIAKELQRKNEMRMAQQNQAQFIQEQVLLQHADPQKHAEARKKTELLNQLEMLESAFSADEKKLTKLKGTAGMESPRRLWSRERRRELHLIRVPGPLPFSKDVPPLKKMPPVERQWK